jgi:hypothetical protein
MVSWIREFYAYKSYLIGVNEYRIIPLTFPRNNFDVERLDCSVSSDIFNSKGLNGKEGI